MYIFILKLNRKKTCLNKSCSSQGWGENDRGVSFTFGADVVSKFLNRHDLDLICRAHQVQLEPPPSLPPLVIKQT